MIVVLSADLLDRSRFPPGSAFVGSAGDLAAGPGAVDPAGVIAVDLRVAGAVDAVRRLRRGGCTARIVAYGRHGDRDLLAEARAAGCDRVLARSAFFADVAGALAGGGRG